MKQTSIRNANIFLLASAAFIFLFAGCVRRTVTITSSPTGAGVYLDDKHVGETPVEVEFYFYGAHRLELAKPGYENYRTTLKLNAPIYQYIPLDFIAECFLPLKLHDAHHADYTLKEGTMRPPAVYEKKVEEKKEKEEGEKKDEQDKLFE